jgi:hypothetical protein
MINNMINSLGELRSIANTPREVGVRKPSLRRSLITELSLQGQGARGK